MTQCVLCVGVLIGIVNQTSPVYTSVMTHTRILNTYIWRTMS